MDLYSYAGPVLLFEKCVANKWSGKTWAVSEAKARSNLSYQAKKELGLVSNVRITLPEKIIKETNNG